MMRDQAEYSRELKAANEKRWEAQREQRRKFLMTLSGPAPNRWSASLRNRLNKGGMVGFLAMRCEHCGTDLIWPPEMLSAGPIEKMMVCCLQCGWSDWLPEDQIREKIVEPG